MVRVLIVDDSSFMRRSLETLMDKSPDIEIVGTAANGQEALEMCRDLDPDVVTLDIEMPVMDGLTALKKIMAENPLPVIMISSLTSEGADVTLEALEVGALDYITKPSSMSLPDVEGFAEGLIRRVKALALRKPFLRLRHRSKKEEKPECISDPGKDAVRKGRDAARTEEEVAKRVERRRIELQNRCPEIPSLEPAKTAKSPTPIRRGLYDLVVVGVSTGGPPAVQKILAELPENFPAPIVIAQHMPGSFTGPFAARLDSLLALKVKEAEGEEALKPGWVYVCPGGKHLRIQKKAALTGLVTLDPQEALYKPSVDVLMETAGEVMGAKVLGIMLTGMGSDGLKGAEVLKDRGGRLLAQSERSCVVYGMPKAVVDAGLADDILDIDDIGPAIVKHFAV